MAWGWLLVATLQGCSCSAEKTPENPGGAGDRAGTAGTAGMGGTGSTPNGGGAAASLGGQGGGGDLRISIQASNTSLCPGQCTELVANAAGGHAPYAFAWNRDLPPSAGPHEVCPAETTAYEVIARDTAIDGEFGRASQSTAAEITIDVAAAGDGACSSDGGVIDPPDERELCSITIAFNLDNPAYFSNFGTALSTDELGNLYVVGWHIGTLDLGRGAVTTSGGARDGFVAKYDEACQLVWHQALACPGCDISLYGGDVGPREVVVVGNARAYLELDVVSSDERWADSALLVQLDRETGELTRGAIYDTPNVISSLYDVGVDARGDIAMIGFANEPITIEGVPLLTNTQMFVAKITAEGEHVFSYPIEYSHVGGGRIAVHADGDIALSARAEGGAQIGITSIPIQATGPRRFVAGMTAAGQVTFMRELDMDVPNSASLYPANALAIDGEGNLLVEQHTFTNSDGDELPEQLMKLDALGNHVWTRDVSSSAEHRSTGAEGAIATDALGNIIHTDEVEVGPDTQGDGAEDDVIVRKLAPDGTELWRHSLDTHRHEITWGIAVSPDDSIWIAHGAFAGTYNAGGTLFITKLAP